LSLQKSIAHYFATQSGYKKTEEIFEHVTKGKSRDIKIGIRLWKKRKGKLYIPYEISNKCTF